MRSRCASICAGLLLASAAFAQQVKTHYLRSTDFGRYKTFSWQDVQTQDARWADRIKDIVGAALKAKGWALVDSDGDVAIVATERIENRQVSQALATTIRDRRQSSGVDSVTLEIFVVDLLDATTKKIIWSGSSASALSDEFYKNVESLDNGTQKMFAHFPPRANKKK
jgi:hypothetical protein